MTDTNASFERVEAALGGKPLPVPPPPQGTHGRSLTLDEVLTAFATYLGKNNRHFIRFSGTMNPVALPGHKLTELQGGMTFKSALNGGGKKGRVISNEELITLFGTDQSSCLRVDEPESLPRYDKVLSESTDFVSCDRSVISFGRHAYRGDMVIFRGADRYNAGDYSCTISIPYNLALALAERRPDLIRKYWGHFNCDDWDGFEQQCTEKSVTYPEKPAPKSKTKIKAEEPAPPLPVIDEASTRTDLLDIRSNLPALIGDTPADERAVALVQSIREAGPLGLSVLDDFGWTLDETAAKASTAITAILLASSLNTATLDEDLSTLYLKEAPLLERQPLLSRLGVKDPVRMNAEQFRATQLQKIQRAQTMSQRFASASKDRRRELLQYVGIFLDMADALGVSIDVLDRLAAQDSIASDARMVKTIESRKDNLGARRFLMGANEEYLQRFIDDEGVNMDFFKKFELALSTVSVIIQKEVADDTRAKQDRMRQNNDIALAADPILEGGRAKTDQMLKDLRAKQEASTNLSVGYRNDVVLKI